VGRINVNTSEKKGGRPGVAQRARIMRP